MRPATRSASASLVGTPQPSVPNATQVNGANSSGAGTSTASGALSSSASAAPAAVSSAAASSSGSVVSASSLSSSSRRATAPAPLLSHAPRSSPRLAQKLMRRQNATPGSSNEPASAAAAMPPPSSNAIASASAAASQVSSDTESAAGSELTSPSLASLGSSPSLSSGVHTPLRQTRGRPPAPLSCTPSPISLPPPSMSVRRKLTHPPAFPASPHTRRAVSLAAAASVASPSSTSAASQAMDAAADGEVGSLLPDGHALLLRSASAPHSHYAKKLPCTLSEAVDYITPRTAAILLASHWARQAQNVAAADNTSAAASSPTAASDLSASPMTPTTPATPAAPAAAVAAAADDAPGTFPIPILTGLSVSEQVALREWGSMYDAVHVIDARFPYEFQGGCIRGARNITSMADAEEMFLRDVPTPLEAAALCTTVLPLASQALAGICSPLSSPPAPSPTASPVSPSSSAVVPRVGSRVCVLIHCEFSKHRGPKCFSYLRRKDRDLMGVELFPAMYYPEMYVIQGGYQAFFSQGYAAFCTPPAYVSMLDRRYIKEHAIEWKKMKRSTGVRGASPTAAMAAAAARERERERECGGGSGSGGKCPPPMSRRTARTRSWSEMEADGSPLPASAASPSLTPMHSPATAAAAAAAAAGSPTIPSHPRVSRGLSLSLDNAATGAPRRPVRDFSLNLAAAGRVSPRANSSAFTPCFGSSPMLTPTHCPSPSPAYGWSFEGRSITPSPFQGLMESPRVLASPSPLPMWSSPPFAPTAANSAMLLGSGSSSSSARATPQPPQAPSQPLQMAPLSGSSEEAMSPLARARSGSTASLLLSGGSVPPVFVNSASSANLPSIPAVPAAAALPSPTGMSSPRALGLGFGLGLPPQAQSPSSALHGLHLRASPSVSKLAASSTQSQPQYSPTPSLGRSPSPSRSLCDTASPSDSRADSPPGSPISLSRSKKMRLTRSHGDAARVPDPKLAPRKASFPGPVNMTD